MLLFGTLSEYHCKIANEFYLLIAFFFTLKPMLHKSCRRNADDVKKY